MERRRKASEKERKAFGEMGKTGENNFSQQQPPTHRSFPSSSCSHLPLFSSPCYFLLKIAPRRGALLGGSPPERRPCSSHAGNNLSLLQKNQKLLEGSTSHTSSSSSSHGPGFLPGCRRSMRLHVPPPRSRSVSARENVTRRRSQRRRSCGFMHFVPDSNLQLPFSVDGFVPDLHTNLSGDHI